MADIFSFEETIKLQDSVSLLLTQNGIKKPKGNRFDAYKSYLLDSSNNRYKKLEDLQKAKNLKAESLIFLMKDYIDLLYILSNTVNLYSKITNKTQKKELKKRIILALKGELFVEDEGRTLSLERDTVFELIIGSQFYAEGFSNIQFPVNPDVLVSEKNVKLGFECKRIRTYSDQNIRRVLFKAVDQIKKHKELYDLRFVALDISKKFGNSQIIHSSSKEEFNNEMFNYMLDFRINVETLSKKLKDSATNSTVHGLFLYSSGLLMLPEGLNIYVFNYIKSFEDYSPSMSKLFYNIFADPIRNKG